MKVKYIEKGIPVDFKRIDKIKTVNFIRAWKSGGLLYGYRDQFGRSISRTQKTDIHTIQKKNVLTLRLTVCRIISRHILTNSATNGKRG